MTDRDFKDKLAAYSKQTKKHTKEMVEAFKDVLIDSLISEGKVVLMGIGTYELKESGERKGINPQTKKEITIPARKRISFTPSDSLRKQINGR